MKDFDSTTLLSKFYNLYIIINSYIIRLSITKEVSLWWGREVEFV